MLKIAERLYIGKCSEFRHTADNRQSIIYTCHWPCSRAGQTASPLTACPGLELVRSKRENGCVQFLDIVNTEIPGYRVADVACFLDLIDQRLEAGKVHLISEHGESRAPSLGLLWLAFRARLISRSSLAAARTDFTCLFPGYAPWPGWVIFCEPEWDALH